MPQARRFETSYRLLQGRLWETDSLQQEACLQKGLETLGEPRNE
jgi:hypothetical protein